MIIKKAQITVVEMSFVALLFAATLVYLVSPASSVSSDYRYNIDSFLDTINTDSEFRDLILAENLSNSTIDGDWSNVENLLNNSFRKYELRVLNETTSKLIYSCNTSYDKYFVERLISISNLTNYEFRKVRLGVCY